MDGQLYRDANAKLGGIASGSTTGSITNGTFAYDEPTMRSLVTNWLDLADDYDLSLDESLRIAQVEGPGLDYASKAQADAANASGRAYLAYLEHNRDYCYEQAQLCQNALDDYLGVEHHNVKEINQSGKPLDDGPQPKV
jgi:hypothetical protein